MLAPWISVHVGSDRGSSYNKNEAQPLKNKQEGVINMCILMNISNVLLCYSPETYKVMFNILLSHVQNVVIFIYCVKTVMFFNGK